MNFLDKLRKLAGMEEGNKEFPLTHVSTSPRPASRRATTSPGNVRHKISHRRNYLKKASKPFNGGMPRTLGLEFRHRWPAPTLDAVRRMEHHLGFRLIVKGGRVFPRDNNKRGLDWNAINATVPGTASLTDLPSPGIH